MEYTYVVRWAYATPPISRNLAIVNRRIRREDPNAPELTEDGFSGVWIDPKLTAIGVYRILLRSNANPGIVYRVEVGRTSIRKDRATDEFDERCDWLPDRYCDEFGYSSRSIKGRRVHRRKIGGYPHRYLNRRFS